MIKIEHLEIDNIAFNYYDDIREQLKLRCDFLINVLDVLFNGQHVDAISQHRLHGTTRKILVNQFLKNNKVTKQNQYGNVMVGNCYQWVNQDHELLRSIAVHLNSDENLEKLLINKPEDLVIYENQIINQLGININNVDIKTFVNNILAYSLFDKYAYEIAKNLGVNTCPYCNRNYINTVIDKNGKELIRPTFDHFLPQKHHPFLVLSFYNLIPSCYYCNSSLKRADNISLETHIHPYIEGFDDDAIFSMIIKAFKEKKSDPENYSIYFKDNTILNFRNNKHRRIFGGTGTPANKNEGSINLFKLTEIYQSHRDIVGELVVKCDKLSQSYSDSLKSLFQALGTNKSEFYQFYFGNYYNENDFNRRPMAKLTRDIISQEIPQFFGNK